VVNPIIATFKLQSNGPSYSNTAISRASEATALRSYTNLIIIIIIITVTGTLTLTSRLTVLSGTAARQAPPRCTKCDSPPINSQCTNFVLFDVAL